MKGKLESFLIFISGFLVSTVAIAYYRYQTVFAELCQRMAEEQLSGSSAGLMAQCPGFEQVFLVTMISPLYFLVSGLIGFLLLTIFWKIRSQ